MPRKTRLVLVSLFVVGLAVFIALSQTTTPSAEAHEDPTGPDLIFMRVEGIEGELTEEDHEGWSRILSVNLSNAIGSFGEGLGNTGSSFEDLVVVKNLDSAGPALQKAQFDGQVLPEVEIEFVKTRENPFVFYEIHLTNVQVTSYSLGTTGQSDLTPAGLPLVDAFSDLPVEQVTFVFEEITITYTEQEETGAEGEKHTFTYESGR